MLGLKFREIPEASTWHDDVLPFEVKDKNTGEMLGHIYLDLYSRAGKNGHGSVRSLIKRSNLDGKVVNPAAMLKKIHQANMTLKNRLMTSPFLNAPDTSGL